MQNQTMVTTDFTPTLTLPSAKICLEVFDEVDKDGNGMVSLDHFEKAVLKIWPDFQQREKISDTYNGANRNGEWVIHREDFICFLKQLSCCENIWNPSSSLISKRESRVSVENILAAVPELRKNDLNALLDEMDINEDGHVLSDEFILQTTVQSRTIRRRSFGAGYHMASSLTSSVLADALEELGEPSQSYLTRVILRLQCSLKILGADATDEEIESWAVLIHANLSRNSRSTCNIEDYFFLTDLVDPYQMIAALFTNFVLYLSDSKTSNQETEALIADVYQNTSDHGVVCISPIDPKVDKASAMVMSIYGYTAGQTIIVHRTFSSYLSAIAATRILKNAMPLKNLAKIVVCIYSLNFIVARRENHNSLKYMSSGLYDSKKIRTASEKSDPTILDPNIAANVVEVFFGRFVEINETFGIGMDERSLVEAMQRGVDLSNRSAGFVVSGFREYMRKSWNMLPFMAPPLQEQKLYSLNDFHCGVQNLLRAYDLSPTTIFSSFRGTPLMLEIESFERKAAQNLMLGRIYVQAVTVTLSIISAFALLSGGCGGDAPMSYFLGEQGSHQLRDDLPEPTTNTQTSCNETVYKSLCWHSKEGSTACFFDNSILPITAYVYGNIGDAAVKKALNYTTSPMKEDSAKSLLLSLPNNAVIPIGRGIAKIAVSRAGTIEQVLSRLKAERKTREESVTDNIIRRS